MTTHLQKRLLSSIEAFARTLKVHANTMEARQQQHHGASLAAAGASLDLLRGGADRDSDTADLPEDKLLNLEAAQTRAALRQTADGGRQSEGFGHAGGHGDNR